MSEEDIKRIEKKVDLLYKYLFYLEKEVERDISYPMFIDYLDELIPLFNLSSKKEEFIKIQMRPRNVIKKELEDLESVLTQGNYLAKEESNIKKKMADLNEELENEKVVQYEKEQLRNINKEIHETLLYQYFRKKIGIKTVYDMDSTFELDSRFRNFIEIKNVKNELLKEGINYVFDFKRDYLF